MPDHFILWPTLVYLGAALIAPRLRRWVGSQGYTLLILLSGVGALLMALLVVAQRGGDAEGWTLSVWQGLAGVEDGIRFRVDEIGASFLLLTALLAVGVLVATLDESEQGLNPDYQGGLLAMLGGLSAMALADNLLTLLLASLILDASFIFGVGLVGRPRWLLAIFIHSLVAQALALSALLLLWRDSGGTLLTDASQTVLLLLLLAAMARLAALPFSLFPVAFETLPARVLAILPLATLGAGSLWLGRVAMAGTAQWDGLAGVGALGVALGGWVAWRRRELSVRLMMLAAVQAAWVLWAFAWGAPTTALAVAWSGVLALAALAIHGGRLDFRHGAQLPAAIGALMLGGGPGSALWTAATYLGGLAWQRGDVWLLAMAVIGVMTTVLALAQWLMPEQTEPHQRSRWGGAIALAAWSVPAIGALWGIRAPEMAQAVVARGPLAAQLSPLVLGWAGGLLLWRDLTRFQSLRPLLDTASALFSFIWLWRIVGRVGWLLLSGVRGMMLVLEGENYGWLLLFLFLSLVFLAPQ